MHAAHIHAQCSVVQLTKYTVYCMQAFVSMDTLSVPEALQDRERGEIATSYQYSEK